MSTRLGRGSYGTVTYRRRTGYVVKRYTRTQGAVREIGILQHLGKHARIANLVGIGAREIYLRHGGQSLRRLLEGMSGGASTGTGGAGAQLMEQVVAGVRFMHERGVAHRDIKPENMLVDAEMNLSFCDFGLSIVPGNAQIPATPGTAAYAAPELSYVGTMDAAAVLATDMWSTGCVLFEIACGQQLFDSDRRDTECYGRYTAVDAIVRAKVVHTAAEYVAQGMAWACLAQPADRPHFVPHSAAVYWYERPVAVYADPGRSAWINDVQRVADADVDLFVLTVNLCDRILYGEQTGNYSAPGIGAAHSRRELCAAAADLAQHYLHPNARDNLTAIHWKLLQYTRPEQQLLSRLLPGRELCYYRALLLDERLALCPVGAAVELGGGATGVF